MTYRPDEAFRRAMLADWQEHGTAVIAQVRGSRPAEYLRIMAALFPKSPVQQDPYEQLTDEHADDRLKDIFRELCRRNPELKKEVMADDDQ